MISCRRVAHCPDERLDVLVAGALRARVAGAYPPEDGWARLMTRLAQENVPAAKRGARLALPQRAVVWCVDMLDRVLPLLEMPVTHAHEPRGARLAMHWKWLHLHRVTVRLVC